MSHVEGKTAHRIRQARREAGLSLDRLAELADTSRRHLIRLEKGEHKPLRPLLVRIAEATGKPLEFFDDDDEEDALVGIARRVVREELGWLRPFAGWSPFSLTRAARPLSRPGSPLSTTAGAGSFPDRSADAGRRR